MVHGRQQLLPKTGRGSRILTKYPELRFLDRYDLLLRSCWHSACSSGASHSNVGTPQLGTSGWQMLVWGFFVSTIVLYHVTYAINSLAHVFGTQRFPTADHSRNNLWLALITFGEGWHNNHHYYPSAARQGFYWWEIDVTYYILRSWRERESSGICGWFRRGFWRRAVRSPSDGPCRRGPSANKRPSGRTMDAG